MDYRTLSAAMYLHLMSGKPACRPVVGWFENFLCTGNFKTSFDSMLSEISIYWPTLADSLSLLLQYLSGYDVYGFFDHDR